MTTSSRDTGRSPLSLLNLLQVGFVSVDEILLQNCLKASPSRAVVNELEFNYIKNYLDKFSSITNKRL